MMDLIITYQIPLGLELLTQLSFDDLLNYGAEGLLDTDEFEYCIE
jgi:hypothetical protein